MSDKIGMFRYYFLNFADAYESLNKDSNRNAHAIIYRLIELQSITNGDLSCFFNIKELSLLIKHGFLEKDKDCPFYSASRTFVAFLESFNTPKTQALRSMP